MAEIKILVAQEIPVDHGWLRDRARRWFVDGHAYAATQSAAIPALSKCSPAELYHAVWAIMRGAGLGDVLRIAEGESDD